MSAPQMALAAPLSTLEARRLTDEVKADATALWVKLLRLYEGEAHTALGFKSWGAYYEAEFGRSDADAYRVLQAARVVGQLPIGSPQPANESVARELVPVLREDPAEVEEVWAEVVELHGTSPTAAETRAVVEEKRSGLPSRTPNSNEWYTPTQYVEAARRVLGGIDLDPASCEVANATVKATRYLTKDDDGLAHPWVGRVWMNPPYGGHTPAFCAKLVDHYQAGDVSAAISLVNGHSTDAGWFHDHLWRGTVCFTRGRIKFEAGDGSSKDSPTYGSAFAYFGPHPERFAGEFSEFGAIVRRWPS